MRFIALLVILFIHIVAAASKPVIYLYDGPGACTESLEQTLSTLKALVPDYETRKIKAQGIKNGDLAKGGVLLIMPGGADIPYCQELSPDGNAKIRTFVENGGCYLGFCAGAYYGAKDIRFAAGTSIEVIGKRDLSFYPGTAEGPVLAPYDGEYNSGARVATLRVEGKEVFGYFNGGCQFIGGNDKPNVTPLATYAKTRKPAIVEIKVGKGTVILSGVHVEYSPDFLDKNDSYLIPIAKELSATDSDRLALMSDLLRR